jgi:acyl dehydratase
MSGQDKPESGARQPRHQACGRVDRELPGLGHQMAGLYFEQFFVGQKFVHEIRRTVTDMDNILFSALTYNPAAVHIDTNTPNRPNSANR